jgi:hypothetical protein
VSGREDLGSIVVYMVEEHPLELGGRKLRFRWLHSNGGSQEELRGLIGAFDSDRLRMLVDERPAGPAWQQLLSALSAEQVKMVITHLAPLTSAQRQQLIGMCAQSGAQLITPGDAGRNRPGEHDSRTL